MFKRVNAAILFIFFAAVLLIQPPAQAWPPGEGEPISSTNKSVIHETTAKMWSELSKLRDTAAEQEWAFSQYDVQREAVISRWQVQARQGLSSGEAVTFDATCNKTADRRASLILLDENRYTLELPEYLDQ